MRSSKVVEPRLAFTVGLALALLAPTVTWAQLNGLSPRGHKRWHRSCCTDPGRPVQSQREVRQ